MLEEVKEDKLVYVHGMKYDFEYDALEITEKLVLYVSRSITFVGYLHYMLENCHSRSSKYATLSSLLINNANSTTIHKPSKRV